jgi:L-galactose dehydrogenase/L-glyceraldehyde 3-phosphate reductase
MVKGAPADQERAVARALEHGITYFDTAAQYGDGQSERNLGRVLKALKPEIHVGTKVRLPALERGRIGPAIAAALEASLQRLGLERVDLFQLHNRITAVSGEDSYSPEIIRDEIVPAFERLRQQGKIAFFGITAIGETAALAEIVDARLFDTAQVPLNLLNPSPAGTIEPGLPAHDFAGLLSHTKAAKIGVIGIRALAGGALSGSPSRHPLGSPVVAPIGSAADYQADVGGANRFLPLVREGHAESLVEAALRFVIADERVATMLIGLATIEQLDEAARAVAKGHLSRAALARVAELHAGLRGA